MAEAAVVVHVGEYAMGVDDGGRLLWWRRGALIGLDRPDGTVLWVRALHSGGLVPVGVLDELAPDQARLAELLVVAGLQDD